MGDFHGHRRSDIRRKGDCLLDWFLLRRFGDNLFRTRSGRCFGHVCRCHLDRRGLGREGERDGLARVAAINRYAHQTGNALLREIGSSGLCPLRDALVGGERFKVEARHHARVLPTSRQRIGIGEILARASSGRGIMDGFGQDADTLCRVASHCHGESIVARGNDV